MTKANHQIGEDIGVYYDDDDMVAAYGLFDSLDAACWEVIERLWNFYSKNEYVVTNKVDSEVRAILINRMAGKVTLRHMWGKKCPVNKYEFEEYGGAWIWLEREVKPTKGRGWFPFTRLEVIA